MNCFVVRVTSPSGAHLLRRGQTVHLFDTEKEARSMANRKNAHPNAALMKFAFAVEPAIACTDSRYGKCGDAADGDAEPMLCPIHRAAAKYRAGKVGA